jgi:hypothetical protein
LEGDALPPRDRDSLAVEHLPDDQPLLRLRELRKEEHPPLVLRRDAEDRLLDGV